MVWPQADANRVPKTVNGANDFINPYNFIRTPDRPNLESGNALADREPRAHDTFQEETYSGVIPITITARSPLLLVDQADKEPKNDTTPPILSTRCRFDDAAPMLLGSSVKGMLRSAYEAITNSRFGVFNKKERGRLGSLRCSTSAASQLLPGWVKEDEDGLKLEVREFVWTKKFFRYKSDGSPICKTDGSKKEKTVLAVPMLPIIEGKRLARKLRDSRKSTADAELLDKKLVFSWLQLKNYGTYLCWEVVAGSLSESKPDEMISCGDSCSVEGDTIKPILVEGIIHWTDSNFPKKVRRQTKNKRCERLIPMRIVHNPNDTTDGKKLVTLEEVSVASEDVETKWEEALRAYKEAYAQPSASNNSPGRYVAASNGGPVTDTKDDDRPITAPNQWRLEKGRTFYVELETAHDKSQRQIKQITPALIGRDLYSKSPGKLLLEQHHPAKYLCELSPADRVFGWVPQQPGRSENSTGWKGLLQIDPPKLSSTADSAILEFSTLNGLELGTLGSPKVSQARFYSATTNFRPSGDGQPKSSDIGFTGSNSRLRGRKVYLPHADHLDDTDNYWNPQKAQEGNPFRVYTRWNDPNKPANADVNVNIRNAVAIGAQFKTAIRFQQLTAAELGALVWLLALPENAVLGLGLAKPYGFGSVAVHPDAANTIVRTATEEQQSYLKMEPTPNKTTEHLTKCFSAFERFLDTGDMAKVKGEFLDAVCGFKSDNNTQKPLVHYPMTQKQFTARQSQDDTYDKRELFRWWVENDRIKNETVVHGKSLPPLGDDPPVLERYSEPENSRPRSNRQNSSQSNNSPRRRRNVRNS